MSRPPRILSKTGLYHIVFRGINRQDIFEEYQDYQKMLEVIRKVKEDKEFEIYAYCLMSNHVHLFIKEKDVGDIKKIMHKILTRYVVWFNYKYQRSGSLIGNRYKSEPIEDDSYFLTLVRYIHQNPIKAGMVENLEQYKWSSYKEYISLSENIVDINLAFSMISENRVSALKRFKEFHNTIEEMDFSISNTKKLTDEQLRRKIMQISGVRANDISLKPKSERNQILVLLRSKGLTIGQLERITGISRGIISRAKNVQKQARP